MSKQHIRIDVPADAAGEEVLLRVQIALGRHATSWRSRGSPTTGYGKAVADECRTLAKSARLEPDA